eukprot:m.141108 g.141108  ORF g.141108 m.141108 type:complete len:681 (+) comp14839_c0_seq1:179-2221(+)
MHVISYYFLKMFANKVANCNSKADCKNRAYMTCPRCRLQLCCQDPSCIQTWQHHILDCRAVFETTKEKIGIAKCGHCLKPASFHCGNCYQCFYCSVACQKIDWSLHRPLCQIASDTITKLLQPLIKENREGEALRLEPKKEPESKSIKEEKYADVSNEPTINKDSENIKEEEIIEEELSLLANFADDITKDSKMSTDQDNPAQEPIELPTDSRSDDLNNGDKPNNSPDSNKNGGSNVSEPDSKDESCQGTQKMIIEEDGQKTKIESPKHSTANGLSPETKKAISSGKEKLSTETDNEEKSESESKKSSSERQNGCIETGHNESESKSLLGKDKTNDEEMVTNVREMIATDSDDPSQGDTHKLETVKERERSTQEDDIQVIEKNGSNSPNDETQICTISDVDELLVNDEQAAKRCSPQKIETKVDENEIPSVFSQIEHAEVSKRERESPVIAKHSHTSSNESNDGKRKAERRALEPDGKRRRVKRHKTARKTVADSPVMVLLAMRNGENDTEYLGLCEGAPDIEARWLEKEEVRLRHPRALQRWIEVNTRDTPDSGYAGIVMGATADTSKFCFRFGESCHTYGGALVKCKTCKMSFHKTCLDYNSSLFKKVQELANNGQWQCQECKVCEVCGAKENEEDFLLCDLCDAGYHKQCLDKEPAEEDAEWCCPKCEDVCVHSDPS